MEGFYMQEDGLFQVIFFGFCGAGLLYIVIIGFCRDGKREKLKDYINEWVINKSDGKKYLVEGFDVSFIFPNPMFIIRDADGKIKKVDPNEVELIPKAVT